MRKKGVNGYREPIGRTKGVTLIGRTRQRVETGSRVNKDTGEITAKPAWRSFKTVIGQVRTRLTEWILTPQRMLPIARALAQARFASMAPVSEAFSGRTHARRSSGPV